MVQSKVKNPDIRRTMKLLSELPLADVNDKYTAKDLSREFKVTFLDQPHNRRVLSKIFDMAPLLGTVHVHGSPEATAFNEGRRSVVLEVLSYLLFDDSIDTVVR